MSSTMLARVKMDGRMPSCGIIWILALGHAYQRVPPSVHKLGGLLCLQGCDARCTYMCTLGQPSKRFSGAKCMRMLLRFWMGTHHCRCSWGFTACPVKFLVVVFTRTLLYAREVFIELPA